MENLRIRKEWYQACPESGFYIYLSEVEKPKFWGNGTKWVSFWFNTGGEYKTDTTLSLSYEEIKKLQDIDYAKKFIKQYIDRFIDDPIITVIKAESKEEYVKTPSND